MAYSSKDLAEILTAERQQYERLVAALVQSRALQIASGHAVPEDMDICPEWADKPAAAALDLWRKMFAPARVGLPVGPSWFPDDNQQQQVIEPTP